MGKAFGTGMAMAMNIVGENVFGDGRIPLHRTKGG